MDYLAAFINEKRLSLSAGTIKQYTAILERFSRYIGKPLDQVEKRDIVAYLNDALFERHLSKTTVANEQVVIGCFYDYMTKQGFIAANPCADISAIKPDKKAPVVMTVNEVNKLMDAAEGEDTLIMELLYATGVRVSELVSIKKKDIDFDRCTIKVFGKGAKERMVLFTESVKADLLARCRELQADDLLFNVTTRTVQRKVKTLTGKAGIEKHITPHKIRHSFATHVLQNGGNVVAVQKLLGHESLNTTQIYTHYSVDELKGMYDHVHPLAKN
jgi:integrase/recombinase XerD